MGLPITLQIIKDEFDRMAEGQKPEIDPDYDFDADVGELMSEGRTPEDIMVIWCPACAQPSYYNEGFTASCHCCGFYNLADHSEEAMTLADWWYMCEETKEILGVEEDYRDGDIISHSG